MSSYRTLVDHAAQTAAVPPTSAAALPDAVAQSLPYIDCAAHSAADSPTRLHRMFKYWRNNSAKIPGLRKSESFAEYRRHSAGAGATSTTGRGTLPSSQQQRQQVTTRYQRLESYDESKLQQMR